MIETVLIYILFGSFIVGVAYVGYWITSGDDIFMDGL